MRRPWISLTALVLVASCVIVIVSSEDGSDYSDSTTHSKEQETTTNKDSTTVDSNVPGPMEIMMNEMFDEFYRRALPSVTQFGFDPNISTDCSAALVKFALGLRKMEPWAMQMFDASGKLAPGLIRGTLGDLGNFHECLEVVARKRIDDSLDFTGRFCTVYVNMANNTLVPKVLDRFQAVGMLIGRRDPLNYVGNSMFKGMRNSICIPSVCSKEDISYIATIMAKKIEATVTIRGCTAKGEKTSNSTQRAVIKLISILFLIVGSATVFDVVCRFTRNPKQDDAVSKLEKNSDIFAKLIEILLGMSIVTNTEKLLHTEPRNISDQKLMFIHGMRFFSSAWVILGHTYLIADPTGTTSLSNVISLVDSVFTTVIANAFPSVETFLFVSAFLMSYNVQRSLQNCKNMWFIVPLILLRRYIRLTVPAMLIVGIWLLVPLLGDGAIMNDYKARFLESCEKNWWRVLLHTNNFVPFFDMCLGHLWYIDIDYQLYGLLIIIPIIMLRSPKHGVLIAVISTISTILYIAYTTVSLGLQPTVVFTSTNIDSTVNTTNLVQFRPWAHVGSFNVGIVLGYLIYKQPKIRMQKLTVIVCWMVAACLNLTVLLKPHDWFSVDYVDFSSAECILYAVFHRLAWSLGVAWVAFACATGRAGVANDILSWRALVPLSRLSYGAFLSHVVILLTQLMMQEERIAYNHLTKMMNYFAVTMASFLCAYILYLFCEAPLAVIERMILGGDLFKKPRSRLRREQHFAGLNSRSMKHPDTTMDDDLRVESTNRTISSLAPPTRSIARNDGPTAVTTNEAVAGTTFQTRNHSYL
ncbi:nose resistant to fluoxetine protein 6-like [Varroa jacobsoni]|uniref:Nose resistant-to-fluoxetine protein N-terminal domain-containing protein n=1 Tax=Varroa destructor TaxID=109461 RepID=A0A7M7JYF0_VARDE|nr:nose resistant to fluoxetine protein 6-like [Varroa destructor]XP_022703841.1 nose resistant to fluoxetine protein 6-like [Varroa jacobsoni]